MIMADVFKFLFLILGTLIVMVAYWLLSEALFPEMVDRARAQYSRRPIKTTLSGVLFAIPCLIVALPLASTGNPLAKFIGVAIMLTMLLVALMGSAGLTRHIGHQLPSPADERQPWKRVLRGGIVLSLTFVLPLVGWFMVLPVTLVSGFGAAILAWRGRDKKSQSEPSTSGFEAAAA